MNASVAKKMAPQGVGNSVKIEAFAQNFCICKYLQMRLDIFIYLDNM
jgi:hypothetical protein